MESCTRCGGTLHQVAVLANYKSFVISLMRCEQCGATAELKENAHRLPEEPRPGGGTGRTPRERLNRHTALRAAREPARPPVELEPAEPPKRRPRAKKLIRPFNVRVTRHKGQD